jgi:hypothetical protein
MYPPDILGMMNSCKGIFGIIGSLIYLNLCNQLNIKDAKLPFVGAAALDVLTAIAMVLLGSVGLFGEPQGKEKISN